MQGYNATVYIYTTGVVLVQLSSFPPSHFPSLASTAAADPLGESSKKYIPESTPGSSLAVANS